MQQIVVIHGANSYASYEDFLKSLWDKVLHLDRITFRDWKDNLQKALGEDYEVLQPRMPNPQNAKYMEWKIWFEKLIPQLQDNLILIGHSMGGAFLAKYLSENDFPKHIRATFLVAAPYDRDGGRPLPEFNITDSLEQFEKQGGKIFLYHSTNDPVVEFGELGKFREQLPNAIVREFADREHFNQDELQEIEEDICSLGN